MSKDIYTHWYPIVLKKNKIVGRHESITFGQFSRDQIKREGRQAGNVLIFYHRFVACVVYYTV